MSLLRLLFNSLWKSFRPKLFLWAEIFLIDFCVSISVRPTEHYRQTVLACYDYCWPLHNGSHPSATCVIPMPSVIHPYALMMTHSERLLQESHDCRSHMIFITGCFLLFLFLKRRPMELMTSQHGRTTRSQTDLYQCYHCYKCWIKNLLQQWAPNSAHPSSRIDAGCKVVVILPF